MYQKTNAVSEIKRIGKDSFWAKAEVSAAQGMMTRAAFMEHCLCTKHELLHLSFSYNKFTDTCSVRDLNK